MTDSIDVQPVSAPPLFGIVQATSTDVDELPKPINGLYYVQDRRGFLVHKETKLGRVLVRTEAPATLPEYEFGGYLWDRIPALPISLLRSVRSFFKAALDTMHSEAMVLLTLDDQNEWHAIVPKQKVDYASIDYNFDPAIIPDNQMLLGTIHSHCDFSAFHSSTDETDAKGKDGLHLTFGHVDSDQFEAAVMVSFSGRNWKKKLKDVSGFDTVPLVEAAFPAEWLKQLEKNIHHYSGVTVATGSAYRPGHGDYGRPWNGGWGDQYDMDDWDGWRFTPTTQTKPDDNRPDGSKYLSWDHIEKWPGMEDSTQYERNVLHRSGNSWPQAWQFAKDPKILKEQVLRDLYALVDMLDVVGIPLAVNLDGHYISTTWHLSEDGHDWEECEQPGTCENEGHNNQHDKDECPRPDNCAYSHDD